MRIVLDTNVLISALITTGTPPDRLYRADLTVSGDKRHMLALGSIEGIRIVTARDTLQWLRSDLG